MAHNVYHVVHRPDGWAIERPNADRASEIGIKKQTEATNEAHRLAEGGIVYVHGLNGKIRKEQRKKD